MTRKTKYNYVGKIDEVAYLRRSGLKKRAISRVVKIPYESLWKWIERNLNWTEKKNDTIEVTYSWKVKK